MWCEVMVELKRTLECDSTAGREWDQVGRRKAKKPGRKENAGLTRWEKATYLSDAIKEAGQDWFVRRRIEVGPLLRTIRPTRNPGVGCVPSPLLGHRKLSFLESISTGAKQGQ